MNNPIKNLIKYGIKKLTSSSSVVEVEFQGKRQKAFLYVPYGMFANPSDDILTMLLADQGNEESLTALPSDKANREELDSGEIALGVPSLDARIFFRENGHISFKIGDQEGGDFAARFNELKSGFDQFVSDFNSFVTSYNGHSHVAPGGATGPPTPSGSSTSASIDSAKIEEIELPS